MVQSLLHTKSSVLSTAYTLEYGNHAISYASCDNLRTECMTRWLLLHVFIDVVFSIVTACSLAGEHKCASEKLLSTCKAAQYCSIQDHKWIKTFSFSLYITQILHTHTHKYIFQNYFKIHVEHYNLNCFTHIQIYWQLLGWMLGYRLKLCVLEVL
jgi:hypothetical protein